MITEKSDYTLILEQVSTLLNQRQNTHGDPAITLKMVADFWAVYLGIPISILDVTECLSLLKKARKKSNPTNAENHDDDLGYTTLGKHSLPELRPGFGIVSPNFLDPLVSCTTNQA